MTCEAGDLYLDYSKQRVTGETLGLLVALAERAGLRQRIDAMFAGRRINVTEDRAVLHGACAPPRAAASWSTATTSSPTSTRCWAGCAPSPTRSAPAAGSGHTGRPSATWSTSASAGRTWARPWPIRRCCPTADRSRTFRFVSNVDGADIAEATRDLDPAETLFVVCSKTFTTIETLTNARTGPAWLLDALGDQAAVSRHFVAVSTNAEKVAEFGIDPANMFGFWDWVGGRYSYPSAIGLTLMVAIGPGPLRRAAGRLPPDGRALPRPPRSTPTCPCCWGCWASGTSTSSGPRPTPCSPTASISAGSRPTCSSSTWSPTASRSPWTATGVLATGPVVWGQPGTNGQHAFYQLIHQGTRLIPCDFLGFCRPAEVVGDHHDLLMANFLAQTEALAFGKTTEEVEAEGVAPDLAPTGPSPATGPPAPSSPPS
jgi:glucose-6-phosphate isomerase